MNSPVFIKRLLGFWVVGLMLCVSVSAQEQQRRRHAVSVTERGDTLWRNADESFMADSVPTFKVNLDGRGTDHFQPDPIRAMWLGLVFPGGGQIYNRKYWKLPVFYGGFLGCMYALTWNNLMLRDYSQAYLDIMDDDPGTASYLKMLPPNYDITGREDRFKTIFQNRKDRYRRYRDMSVFAFIGVYALSVVDAYVDAELSTFDISPSLSMELQPAVIRTQAFGEMGGMGGNSYGIQVALRY